MRVHFPLWGLFRMTTACGEDVLERLEDEAAECPEAPAMRLGEAPWGGVLLNAYYLQEEAARDVRRGLAESPVLEETFAKAAALGAWAVRTNGHNEAAERRGDSAIQKAPLLFYETAVHGLDRGPAPP